MKIKKFRLQILLIILFSTALIITGIRFNNQILYVSTILDESDQDIKQDIQSPLTSAWEDNGTVIISDSNKQYLEGSCSDDNGGAYIIWEDNRTGIMNYSIFVQRIDSNGNRLWDPNGAAVCLGTESPEPSPVICADGNGNAIIAWEDSRNGNVDIYAQKINSTGDPKWDPNGIIICTNDSMQMRPKIISDGAGGAIIAWTDYRHGVFDIYIQKIDFNGDRQWYNPTYFDQNGNPVIIAAGSQYHFAFCSDEAEGAIFAYIDERPPFSSMNQSVYAQRIDHQGDQYWGSDGVAICTTANFNDVIIGICEDQERGAIIVWNDNRTSGIDKYADIYAQRVNEFGVRQWKDQGLPVCNATFEQHMENGDNTVVSDGKGGALIVWEDKRNGATDDIYAQRLNSLGEPMWELNGEAICTESLDQGDPFIQSDRKGGGIIAWEDERSITSDEDIYAQYINSYGTVQWATNGLPVCNSNGDQYHPLITIGNAGNAIIVWNDERNGIKDIYGYRVVYTSPTSPPSDGDDDDDDDKKSDEGIPGYDIFLSTLIIFAISLVILYKNRKKCFK